MPLTKESRMKENLAGVVQFLQAAPENYRAFGPYWWHVKRFIAEHYPGVFHWTSGRADDPIARDQIELEHDTEQAVLEAACDHVQLMVVQGTPTIGSGNLPDGTPYQLDDPDMGAINRLT